MDKVTHPLSGALVTLALLTLFVGCGTVRETAGSDDARRAQAMVRRTTPLSAIAQPLSNHTDLSLRMAVEATYGDKTLPVKGNLRMRRGECIQMAFTALGMIEVARVEMTPGAVWIIDRLNKQYAKVSYAELPLIGSSYVNFSLVESLLWNELFIPGQKNVATQLDKFVIEPTGTQQLIQPKDQKSLACRFWADADITRLQKTRLQFGNFISDWSYSGYQLVDDTRYPSLLNASVEAGGKKVSARLTFTGITLDNKDWTTRTNLANYTQITATELLSKLSKIIP